jgi:hypothetical protein
MYSLPWLSSSATSFESEPVQDWLRLVPVGEKVGASLCWMIVRYVRYELFSEILRYR